MTNLKHWRSNGPWTKEAMLRKISNLEENIRSLAAFVGNEADKQFGGGSMCSIGYQIILPHRKLADDHEIWSIERDSLALAAMPGLRLMSAGLQQAGIPFGPIARLIMIYLRSEALRSGSRNVELGGELRGFLTRLGMSMDGDPGLLVHEQLERFASCRFRFDAKQDGFTIAMSQSIVEYTTLCNSFGEDGGGCAPIKAVRLDEVFHRYLVKDAVLLSEDALREIRGASLALDIYCWLACRLHALTSKQPIAWDALAIQFAGAKQFGQDFMQVFVEALGAATRVYPQAKVEVMEAGIVLRPSPPPTV